jgi:hypothetical protein
MFNYHNFKEDTNEIFLTPHQKYHIIVMYCPTYCQLSAS